MKGTLTVVIAVIALCLGLAANAWVPALLATSISASRHNLAELRRVEARVNKKQCRKINNLNHVMRRALREAKNRAKASTEDPALLAAALKELNAEIALLKDDPSCAIDFDPFLSKEE